MSMTQAWIEMSKNVITNKQNKYFQEKDNQFVIQFF